MYDASTPHGCVTFFCRECGSKFWIRTAKEGYPGPRPLCDDCVAEANERARLAREAKRANEAIESATRAINGR